MSYPPPPPVPGSPQGQPPGAKPRLRGRIPLRLAIIFLALGVIGIVVGGVVGFSAGLNQVKDFQRISLADGTGTLHFDAGKYLAYYEAPDFDESGNTVPIILLKLTNKQTGASVAGNLYGDRSGNKVDRLTYSYDGHKGAALYEFTIKTSGDYTAELASTSASKASSKSDLAFGKSIATGLAVGGVLAILGLLLLIAGIVLLIVGLVKRSRSKKELAAAQAYYGGGYPPPGYGQNQPGYGQSQQPGYGQNPPGYGQNQQPGYGQNPQGSPQDQSWQQPPSLRKDDDQQGPWPPRQQ